MRFQQQFGDTKKFAIKLGFRDDPEPPPDADRDLVQSWGDFQIWVGDVCLTRHTYEGEGGDAVTWYLLPLFEWLDSNAVELLNREPFAFPISRTDVGTALDWLDFASGGRPPKATEWTDDAWDDQRYGFWRTHSLRAGMPGAAVPHVVFHRVGESIEVSWDNEDAPPPRRGLKFLSPKGAALVDGDYFAQTLREALQTAYSWLKSIGVHATTAGPLSNGHALSDSDWQLLLPPNTAKLAANRPSLERRLATNIPLSGAYIPHTLESSILRGVDAKSEVDLEHAEIVTSPPQHKFPPSEALERVRRPSPALRWRPWTVGYQMAETVRDRLGWGDQPLHPLEARLTKLGIEISDATLPPEADCVAVGFGEEHTRVVVKGSSRMAHAMRLATAFGHVLLDVPRERPFGVVSSPWTDGPTVARAKAFGAMLLMPEQRCRDIARRFQGPRLVEEVMKTFETPRIATTWHLYHLRLIDQDDMDDVRFGGGLVA